MKEPFETSISIFKNLFNAKETPFTLQLTDVFERIKIGYPELINKINIIRNSENKEEVTSIKNSLLAIMFNGTFSDRNDNGLIKHSKCMVLDFDKYPTPEEMQKERERLIKDKYTLMLFTSPSGNGLKLLVRIPSSDKSEHKRRFNAYKDYINSEYFDEKNCNVSRVCFESYDPEIYLNQLSDEFLEIEEEKGFEYVERAPVCILRDEQKIIDRIMKFDLKGDFVDGNRNNYILKLALCFSDYGISQSTAENYILNNVIIGDFSDEEAKRTIKSAYRKSNFDSKYFEDNEKIRNVKNKLKSGVSPNEIKKQLNVDDEFINDVKSELIEKEDIFWNIHINKLGVETVTIEPFRYSCFLTKNGFNKYYPESSDNPVFVMVKENKVKLSSAAQIKDFVLSYLLKKGELSVWNYCSKSPYLFQESHLNMIDSIELKMLQDERYLAYIPFKNGVVRVSKNNVDLLHYLDVNGYIWENQIINRDFKKNIDFKNDFQDFVSKVCDSDKDRIKSLESTMGYLIHAFKDKTDQKAIIFNDQEIDDNPNGGSGKSLMITAFSKFRNVVKIDGKAFDPKKSDFVYQRINLDTQVLCFDDVKRNFDFEQLFSLITEGITVNRKNKDEIFIPFERSPKIVISTNYVINGAGSSHDRRRHEIEFYQYFNSKRSPLSEYGRLLFDSWDNLDWEKFDNYMVNSLQMFLRDGLSKTISINADEKRFIQATNKDFYDWVNDGNLSENTRIYNSQILNAFIADNRNYKELNSRTFNKWIASYCDFKNFDLIKNKDHNGRYIEIININSEKIDEVPF
jgi:hypothetical protein